LADVAVVSCDAQQLRIRCCDVAMP